METEWRDLDIDSLELVELVAALEDRFDVKIADGELKSIAGGGDAVRLASRSRTTARLGVSVAVTGRGVVTSLGEGADAFFEARWRPATRASSTGLARLRFDPAVSGRARGITRRVDRYASPQQDGGGRPGRAEADVRSPACDPDRVAVVIGTGVGGPSRCRRNLRLVPRTRRARGLPKTSCR